LRIFLGIGALLSLAIALNVLVATREFFAFTVLGPLVLAAILGGIWLVLVIQNVAGYSVFQGRALGGLNAVVGSLLFLGICIVLYTFVRGWDVSWDLTEEGRRELSEQTRQVLHNMNREVTVTCFFLSVDDELLHIGKEKTLRFLEQCQRYTDMLKVEVEDPQLAVDRMMAMEVNFASPQGTIVIHSGVRKRVITLSGGSPRLEEREFTNALINVLRASEPKVYFLTGHGERDVTDAESGSGAGGLVEVLRRESYQVDLLSLSISNPEVPEDCDVLVINNLAGDLLPWEMEAIQAYMERGGRLFVMLDPWIHANPEMTNEVFRPWLASRYCIEVGSDIALSREQERKYEAQLTVNRSPFDAVDSDDDFEIWRGNYRADHPITQGFDQTMVLQAARTVSPCENGPDGVFSFALLRTNPDFWAESDVASLRERGAAQPDPHERSGALPLAVTAVANTDLPMGDEGRMHQARLVVVGDSDFASNAQVTFPGHINFVMNVFAWLSESEELIAIRPTSKVAPPLYLSPGERRAVAWLSTLFTTQLVLVAGLGVYFWRRRVQ